MTVTKLKAVVHGIIAHLSHLPRAKRMAALREELKKLPRNEADLTMSLVSVALDLTEDPHTMRTWEKVVMICSGGLLILAMLCIAILVPSPTPFQIYTFRTVLGIGLAGFGCTIPGFLHIEARWPNFFARAGGALALFFLTYAYNPPELHSSQNAATTLKSGSTNSPVKMQ